MSKITLKINKDLLLPEKKYWELSSFNMFLLTRCLCGKFSGHLENICGSQEVKTPERVQNAQKIDQLARISV